MATLNPTTAAAYIVAKHAAHGGCAIIAARSGRADGTPYVEVTFEHNGRVEKADVWIEGDELYGEW